MILRRHLLALLAGLAFVGPAFGALTANDANTDVVAAAAPMPASYTFPTSVATGDYLFLAIVEVSAETTTINASDLAGTVNATGWALLSGPTDHTGTTLRTWVFGIVSAGSGTETVTVTRTGTPNGAFGGSRVTTSAGAISFAAAATTRETGADTDCDTNTLTADAQGGVMGVIFTQSDQTLTADGAGETDVSDETMRIHFVWEPYDGTGLPASKGVEATSGTNTAKIMHLARLVEAGGGGSSNAPRAMHLRRLMGHAANDDVFLLRASR
jgi:hypothetical protein